MLWKDIEPIHPTDKNDNGTTVTPRQVGFGRFMIFWSVLGHTFFVLQAYRIWHTKQADGVSVSAYSFYILSAMLWITYGYFALPRRNYVIVTSGIVGIALAILIIVGVFEHSTESQWPPRLL